MIPKTHREVRLAARPVGFPQESDFRLVEASVPEPGGGEFLARVVYPSVEPAHAPTPPIPSEGR